MIQVTYSLLQGLYWMCVCTVTNFAGVTLLSRGYSSAQVGMSVAISSMIAVILQIIISRISDTSKKYTMKDILGIMVVLTFITTILYFVVEDEFLIIGVFTCMAGILLSYEPLLNSLATYYVEKGYDINFGVARGMGSLIFAVFSTLLGWLTVRDYRYSLYSLVILLLLFFLCLSRLPMGKTGTIHEAPEEEKKSRVRMSRSLFYIGLILLGIGSAFIFNKINNTFMLEIMEDVGGNASSMGIAFSLGALTEVPFMFYYEKFRERYTVEKIFLFSIAAFLLKALAMATAKTEMTMLLSQLLQGVSFGLFTPAGVFLIHKYLPKEYLSRGQGYIAAAKTAGGIIGSIIGGYVIDQIGLSALHWTNILFSILAILLIVAAIRPLERTYGKREV